MPFETQAQTKKNVGRGKIRTAASKGKGVLGLTNQDKLRLARSGVKDLLEGTMQANRAKRKARPKQGLVRYAKN